MEKDTKQQEQVSEQPDQQKSDAGKALSSLGAAKGGRARASVLSSDERKAIARKAINARWAKVKGVPTATEQQEQVSEQPDQQEESSQTAGGDKLPFAMFQGKLQIADAHFPVYVLDNEKRVMTQREVVRALTGNVKGGLERYLDSLQPYLDKNKILEQTIKFRVPATQFVATGYEATLLLDICDGYLKARVANDLKHNQVELAKQAEIITRACAKVGIIALIDEATGYAAYKKKQEYQLKLQAFIAEELQEWAKMFPDEFWFELARLEGIHYSPRARPLRWGKYVMMFVYDAVDGDVGNELRKKNPDPHFLQNHHQWLKKFGRDKVHDQITKVVTIMRLCDDMNDFRQKFAKLFNKSPQLSFGWNLKA